jgi:ATP-binding cassette, subfamily G (WHITE), member 2
MNEKVLLKKVVPSLDNGAAAKKPPKALPDDGVEDDHLLGDYDDQIAIAKEEGTLVNFPQIYHDSTMYQDTVADIQREIQRLNDSPVSMTGDVKEYASSFPRQVRILAKRTFIQVIRNPMVTYVQLIQTVFIALLVGSIYFQIGDDQGSIQDRVGALFFVMTNNAFSMIGSLNIFLQERDLFNRERASGCYRTSTYFLSKTFVEAPILLLFPLVFGCIAYYMVGFNPNPECFGVFIATLVTFAACAGSLFLTIGSLSPNVAIAQIFSPLAIVLFMLFGGFYVNVVGTSHIIGTRLTYGCRTTFRCIMSGFITSPSSTTGLKSSATTS